jgi:antitoxin (DNA-binding transcriptional repressor) of toxin-antitoxin stability system
MPFAGACQRRLTEAVMRIISDQDAARDFQNVLTAIASGESVIIARDGVPLARIIPEREAKGDHPEFTATAHNLAQ